MTTNPRGPALSFRNVPAGIYIALGAVVVSSLVFTVAFLVESGGLGERYKATEHWRTIFECCNFAQAIMLSLGLLELAKRHTGAARALSQVAAWLLLADAGWQVANLLIAIIKPEHENFRSVYDWIARVIGVLTLAGTISLTIGADAWRRVPIAAAGIIVIGATGYWVPVIGPGIHGLLKGHTDLQRLYPLLRDALASAALLFVVAALAAGGRDAAPDPRAAAAGFRSARGALVFRLVVAIAFAVLTVAAKSQGFAKVILFGTPLVAIATMIVFAVGCNAVAAARVPGVPRTRLYLAVGITLWSVALQLSQLHIIYRAFDEGRARALRELDTFMFLIAGPLVAILGLALVGSAIASYLRAHHDRLGAAASRDTVGYVLLSIVAVGAQFLALAASQDGDRLLLLLLGVVASLVALLLLASALRRAADQLESTVGLPVATVVNAAQKE